MLLPWIFIIHPKKDELDFCEGDNVQSKIKYVVVQRANVCFIVKE